MADAAVLDLDGEPLTNERLSALLGDSRVSFQVIPGTERRWPQSHSACLLLESSACGAADRRTAFLKVMSARSMGANKAVDALRRDLLSNRVEARFYREFAPILSSRGVELFMALAVDERLAWLDEPASVSATELNGGVLLLLKCADERRHMQNSPLTAAQAKLALSSLAQLHAAAWEDVDLLTSAKARLHEGGGCWWSLAQRGAAEMARMHEVWPTFLREFSHLDPELFHRPSVVELPRRLAALAHWVAEELAVTPSQPHCTLIHGDYKAANLFLPVSNVTDEAAVVPVDFQWVGFGLGMRDVAYHITHAVEVDALAAEGAEEDLVRCYCNSLRSRLAASAKAAGRAASAYDDAIAMRHYRLACVDYARLLLTRFVTDASEGAFAAANAAPRAMNVGVIFRDVRAAPRFIRRLDAHLAVLEAEQTSASSASVE